MALLSLYSRVLKSISLKNFKDIIFNPEKCIFVFVILFFFEIFVNCFVILNITYTEIDWKAYMQETEGFLNGTTDYALLKGDTGPLVYPAGFLYIFAGLYHLTNRGVNVRMAQYLFAGLYQLTIITVFFIYSKVKKVPPYAFFFMCCASYRVHSIYVLRLFNDPVAMTIFYFAVCLMLLDRWTLACVFYSLSVSVKMNLLLFSPSLLILLLSRFNFVHTLSHLFVCAFVQIIIGLPFLLTYPRAYLHGAFEFSRQFFFKWTVNWRFLGEKLFLDRRFHFVLLLVHLTILSLFLYLYCIRKQGGIKSFVFKIFSQSTNTIKNSTPHHNNSTLTSSTANKDSTTPGTANNFATPLLTPDFIVTTLFVGNFIGMSFSRSLHYQFYVWYFHTLPHILWSTRLSSPFRLVLLGLIEMCWNTYPSTNLSCITLHLCHLTILLAVFHSIIVSDVEIDGGGDGVVGKEDSDESISKSSTHLKRDLSVKSKKLK